jgi:hypothetical protein
MIIRIGMVGSRRRNSPADKEATREVLLALLAELPEGVDICMVSGGCVARGPQTGKYEPCGGDRFAEEFAKEYGFGKEIFQPNWDDIDPAKPRKWEAARVLLARNTPIADTSDYLIACVAEDRKGGTEDTIRKFKKREPGEDRMRLVPQC